MESGRERTERRLAAILAADIAGYSRLIGADEEGTLAQLRVIRAECFLENRQRSLVQRLGSRVVAFGLIKYGKVGQYAGNIRIIGTEPLLVNRQRALIKRLGMRVVTPCPI